MAEDVVDDLRVRSILRLDAEHGPAILLAVFLVALWCLLQFNYALFDDLFFQPAPQHDQPVESLLPAKKASCWEGNDSNWCLW